MSLIGKCTRNEVTAETEDPEQITADVDEPVASRRFRFHKRIKVPLFSISGTP